MRKIILYVAVAVAALIAATLVIHAAVNPPAPFYSNTVMIPYQGFLQQDGVPFTTTDIAGTPVTVNLYNVVPSPAATVLFSQQNNLQISGGHFSMLLGSQLGNPLNPTIFNGAGPINLTVTVGATTLSGYQTLYPAPYAQVANYANQSADTFDVANTLNAHANATVAGNMSAASASVTGAMSAASASLTGTMSAASATVSGEISTNTLDVTKFDTCPAGAGYSLVTLTRSTLCVKYVALGTPPNPPGINNYFAAEVTCNNNAGAQLCTYQQMLHYCISNLPSPNPTNTTVPTVPLITNTWFGERSGDSGAEWVNINDCQDFDGVANGGSTTTISGAYCCLEWPKYH
jgi:hypothetical protein